MMTNSTKREPAYKSKTPSVVDWARLAAYIDGEGCIRIRIKRHEGKWETTELEVNISNTDTRLVKWLKDAFCGHICIGKPEPHRNDGVICYRWGIGGRHAEWVLNNCLEYFIIKRDQAEIGLSHQALFRPGRPGLNKRTTFERMALRNKLSLLKGSASWQRNENGIPLKEAV